MVADLNQITLDTLNRIAAAATTQELQSIHVAILGKKGKLTNLLAGIGKVPPEQRPKVGQEINQAKSKLLAAFKDKSAQLGDFSHKKKDANTLDITLQGRGQPLGRLHPITLTLNSIEDYFTKLGFLVADGPEVEDEYHNFEALNTPASHPARAMQDTFYLPGGFLLRSQTSPVQIRHMKAHEPPFRMIAPGKVYRCDHDVTHTPMFHQVEGLMVDDQTHFGDLKGILIDFLHAFFAGQQPIRFRPSYFPFTEPSAEVDIQCFKCKGKGCRLCGHTGWLEVLGCGMVHPNVLQAVDLNPDDYQGFAFGMGIERFAMLRYEIDDIRLLYENNLQFLRQF